MIFASLTASAATLLAQAPAAPASTSNPNFMIMMGLMLVMMYFVLIRPQRKKQKEQETLQKSLAPGDEVITIGGAHGVITSLKEKTVIVRVAEGKIEFDRSAVSGTVGKANKADPAEKLEVIK